MATMNNSIWRYLPCELHIMIVEEMVHREHAMGKSVARYATVNTLWQSVVEQVTLKELNMVYDDLPQFELVFSRVHRRRYLQYIGLEFNFVSLETMDKHWSDEDFNRNVMRLSMEVAKYNPTVDDEAVWEKRANDALVTKTIYEFLGFMSCWKKAETSRHGICLELITNNNSHCQELASRFMEYEEEILDDAIPRTLDEQVRAFLYQSAARDFDRHADWDPSQLPSGFDCTSVDVITGVLICAGNARYISPEVVTRLVSKLPSARYVDWQSKPRFCTYEQHDKLADSHIAAFKQFPATVKSLCLHQLGDSQTWGMDGQQAYDSHKHGNLAAQLAILASSQLETLSVTSAIDARDFFKLAAKTSWPTLKRLTLTTSSFNDELPMHFEPSRPDQIGNLLKRAGKAALAMPQLDFLSLANSSIEGGVNVFFSFQVHKRHPRDRRPAFAAVELFADRNNEHATNDVMRNLSLQQWDEVAARRSLPLNWTVGYTLNPRLYWEAAMTGSLSARGRLLVPMARDRRCCCVTEICAGVQRMRFRGDDLIAFDWSRDSELFIGFSSPS